MKKSFFLQIFRLTVILALSAVQSIFAQQSIQSVLNQVGNSSSPAMVSSKQLAAAKSNDYQMRIAQYFKSRAKSEKQLLNGQNGQLRLGSASDTLYVFKDTVITGTFNHTGPIAVVSGTLKIRKATMTNAGNIIIIGGQVEVDTSSVSNQGFIYVLQQGQLRVTNSQVTNNGDLYVFGNAQVFVNSSTLVFPQTDFYQLSVLLGGAAQMTMNNTTFNCNFMSHGFTVTDSAKLVESNMVLHGFTTTGISSKGSITINGTTQAGEFVITDHSNLNIKNADTVLLWHQFPDTAVINWSFGKGDSAYNYLFNKTKPGVKGVEYNVQVDSSHTVWWALMPSSGSDVTIGNSKIRAIGLWFDKANDSLGVSGIHDSTSYSSGQVPSLSDRKLILNNSYVETWSFYTFKNLKLSISKCQVGEIGSENTSRVYGNNYTVDGTGGYHWTSDSSATIASGLVDYTYARSEKSSIFVIGNSLVALAEAIDQSVLIVVQSTLFAQPNGPQAKDGGVAWFANINQPAPIYINSIANIYGSAWIDRGPSSVLMNYKSYSMYYQKQGDANWTPIIMDVTTEARNSLLSSWNTNGLTEGTYTLRLNLKSTYDDSVDAYLPVMVSGPTGVNEWNGPLDMMIYPNPVVGNVNVSFTASTNEKIRIVLSDLTGRQEFINESFDGFSGKSTIQLNTSGLSAGVYLCRIISGHGVAQRMLVVGKE